MNLTGLITTLVLSRPYRAGRSYSMTFTRGFTPGFHMKGFHMKGFQPYRSA